MQLVKFKDYEEYVETQRTTDERKKISGKTSRGNPRSCAGPYEIGKLADWLIVRAKIPEVGICHGARHGWEVKWFKDHFVYAEIIGTDLFLKADAEVPCIQWDFHDVNPEWIGKADFIYSNALDHSYAPDEALSTWTGQLKLGGHLFLLWSFEHLRAKQGDCFGAYFHEYMQMLGRHMSLVDLIYCGKHKVVLVGEKE